MCLSYLTIRIGAHMFEPLRSMLRRHWLQSPYPAATPIGWSRTRTGTWAA